MKNVARRLMALGLCITTGISMLPETVSAYYREYDAGNGLTCSYETRYYLLAGEGNAVDLTVSADTAHEGETISYQWLTGSMTTDALYDIWLDTEDAVEIPNAIGNSYKVQDISENQVYHCRIQCDEENQVTANFIVFAMTELQLDEKVVCVNAENYFTFTPDTSGEYVFYPVGNVNISSISVYSAISTEYENSVSTEYYSVKNTYDADDGVAAVVQLEAQTQYLIETCTGSLWKPEGDLFFCVSKYNSLDSLNLAQEQSTFYMESETDSVTLRVTSNSSGEDEMLNGLTYQWYYYDEINSEFIMIDGAVDSSYIVNKNSLNWAYNLIMCEVVSSYGESAEFDFNLYRDSPQWKVECDEYEQYLPYKSSTTLGVKVGTTGFSQDENGVWDLRFIEMTEGVSYQWYKFEGYNKYTAIPGAIEREYVTNPVTGLNRYVCLVTDATGLCAWSDVFSLEPKLMRAKVEQTYYEVELGKDVTINLNAELFDDNVKIDYKWYIGTVDDQIGDDGRDYKEVSYECEENISGQSFLELKNVTDTQYLCCEISASLTVNNEEDSDDESLTLSDLATVYFVVCSGTAYYSMYTIPDDNDYITGASERGLGDYFYTTTGLALSSEQKNYFISDEMPTLKVNVSTNDDIKYLKSVTYRWYVGTDTSGYTLIESANDLTEYTVDEELLLSGSNVIRCEATDRIGNTSDCIFNVYKANQLVQGGLCKYELTEADSYSKQYSIFEPDEDGNYVFTTEGSSGTSLVIYEGLSTDYENQVLGDYTNYENKNGNSGKRMIVRLEKNHKYTILTSWRSSKAGSYTVNADKYVPTELKLTADGEYVFPDDREGTTTLRVTASTVDDEKFLDNITYQWYEYDLFFEGNQLNRRVRMIEDADRAEYTFDNSSLKWDINTIYCTATDQYGVSVTYYFKVEFVRTWYIQVDDQRLDTYYYFIPYNCSAILQTQVVSSIYCGENGEGDEIYEFQEDMTGKTIQWYVMRDEDSTYRYSTVSKGEFSTYGGIDESSYTAISGATEGIYLTNPITNYNEYLCVVTDESGVSRYVTFVLQPRYLSVSVDKTYYAVSQGDDVTVAVSASSMLGKSEISYCWETGMIEEKKTGDGYRLIYVTYSDNGSWGNQTSVELTNVTSTQYLRCYVTMYDEDSGRSDSCSIDFVIDPGTGYYGSYTTADYSYVVGASEEGLGEELEYRVKDGSCEIDGHIMYLESALVATCTESGHKEYWSCTRCGKSFLDEDGTAEASWDDYGIAVLGHDLVKSEAKLPTDTESGSKEHWKCSRCGRLYLSNIESTETTWEELYIAPQGHTLKAIEATEPTCTGEGNQKYFRCETCEKLFEDKDAQSEITLTTATIPVLNHLMVKTEATRATCTENGNREYWTCERCGKLFSDDAGQTETTVEELTIAAFGHSMVRKEASESCTETGNKEYWTCSTCGKLYEDADGNAETTLDRVTTAALGHNLTKTQGKEATCTNEGNAEYWYCSRCEKLFADEAALEETTIEAIVTSKIEHLLTKIEEKAASETETGNVEYWICSRCDKLFADEAGQTETTQEKVTVPATGANSSADGGGVIIPIIPAQGGETDNTAVAVVPSTNVITGTTASSTTNSEDGKVTTVTVGEDESQTKVTTVTNKEGTIKTTTKVTYADGSTSSTVTTLNADGSSTKKVKTTEVNSAGKRVAHTVTTKTNTKGKITSVTEKSEIAEVAKNTSATIIIKQDGKGNVTSASATVDMISTNGKIRFSSALIKQIEEVAGGIADGVDITMNVSDKSGNAQYTIIVNTADIVAGNVMYLYKYNTKSGKYTAVNDKKYTVNSKGNVTVSSLSKNCVYKLVPAEESKLAIKQIKSTYEPKKTTAILKNGASTTFELKNGANRESIKSITYSSSDKKIATVSKAGKIKAKSTGKAVITAEIVLKNNKTKTIKMNVTVK